VFSNILSITIPRPCSSKVVPKAGGEGGLKKKYPRVTGCSVPNVTKQKSAF